MRALGGPGRNFNYRNGGLDRDLSGGSVIPLEIFPDGLAGVSGVLRLCLDMSGSDVQRSLLRS
jgi:hypothetical protein